jgi:catechol 2,3-dioxygenase-like lactoylglutathione lyase family enzyme
MALLKELMEVILYVEDMNAQVEFYTKKLGFKVAYPQGIEEYADQMWVTLDTGACTLALHGGGKRRFGQDAPKIVFRVDDILAVREELLRLGVVLGEVRSAAPGVWVCDGEDPEGNKLSIESHE